MDRLAINFFDWFCRDSSDNRMRRHIFRDYRPCRDDRAFAHSDAIRDDRASTQPDVVFYDNAFCRDALLHEGAVGIVEYMIDGNDLCER